MHKVAIIGAGRIGLSIAKLLNHSGDYAVLLADQQQAALDGISEHAGIQTQLVDINDPARLEALLAGQAAVVSACGFDANLPIARSAARSGISYFDLSEDIHTASVIEEIAHSARPGQVFIPQCGLAPGLIGILGHHVGKQFDTLEMLKLRVGALPEFPSNTLMYNLIWSTQGLINEYCNPCHAIKNGAYLSLTPLEGLENFSLDGVEYEAFNTSGGLGTLCDTLQGRVHDLTYKTIRYKGHQYLMDFLINGLRLGERRDLLKRIFENAVAATKQDVVLIMVTATGLLDGQFMQITDSRKIYHGEVNGEQWGAIQITTSAGLCTVLDLFFEGATPQQGYVRQEQIDFTDFIANRFARCFLRRHRRES